VTDQRSRQLARYAKHRPVGDDDYLDGVSAAWSSVCSAAVECPHHSDSGRYVRWTLGYSDELRRIATHLWDTRNPRDPDGNNVASYLEKFHIKRKNLL